jgi:hypothetical protein
MSELDRSLSWTLLNVHSVEETLRNENPLRKVGARRKPARATKGHILGRMEVQRADVGNTGGKTDRICHAVNLANCSLEREMAIWELLREVLSTQQRRLTEAVLQLHMLGPQHAAS